jgi:hypothetical protein
MATITKEIKTLEDLRRRKQRLREEIDLSRQIIKKNLDSVVSQRSIKRALLTMTFTGVATYLFKRMRKEPKEEQAQTFAQAFSANGQHSWAGWLPAIRQVVDFAFEFLERRYAPSDTSRES